MRSLIMLALTAVLIAGISGEIGVAQAASSGSYHQALAGGGMNGVAFNTSLGIGEQPQGWVPAGDYQRTCRDIRTDGYMLKASCQKVDGGWRSSSLDTRNCGSQVVNDNGHLRCTQAGGIPPGDYRLLAQTFVSTASGWTRRAKRRTAAGARPVWTISTAAETRSPTSTGGCAADSSPSPHRPHHAAGG